MTTTQTADVAATLNFDNTLTWLRGAHTFSLGGTFTHINWRSWNDNVTDAGINFGIDSRDPAFSMFDNNSGNYPGGIDATQAGYARQLYSLITGRVSAINGTYQYDGSQYIFNGDGGNGLIANGVGSLRLGLVAHEAHSHADGRSALRDGVPDQGQLGLIGA